MQAILYLFGSGWAFFLGASLLLIALAPFRVYTPIRAACRNAILMVGVVLLAASAAPLPMAFYAMIGLLVAAWLTATRWPGLLPIQASPVIRVMLALTLLAGMVFEGSYQLGPRLEPAASLHLYVIGDSLAAGIGDTPDENWPQLAALACDAELHNLSRAGARIRYANKLATEAQLSDGIVLLEIGGNDMLESAPPAEFARDLEQLLTTVCGSGRQVVMFELPLPPSYNAYGHVQRRLAAKHGVKLIPKRVLMRVLAGNGATRSTHCIFRPQGIESWPLQSLRSCGPHSPNRRSRL